MKIMVCLKQVPHQDARLDIRADGTWIQEDNIKFEINSYDTYALEEALLAKNDGECEVVVVSIGPDRVSQALRNALGMGADRAIHVKDAEADDSDALGVAKILAAVAKEENPDLIYAGMMADDDNVAAVPPMLAELLGIPHTTAALKVVRSNGTVTVDREIEGGSHEVVELHGPCLVAVQTGLNKVRYASLKGIMAAKKKPIEEEPAEAVANQAEVVRLEMPPARKAGRIIGEGPDAVAGLIDALRNEAKVL